MTVNDKGPLGETRVMASFARARETVYRAAELRGEELVPNSVQALATRQRRVAAAC